MAELAHMRAGDFDEPRLVALGGGPARHSGLRDAAEVAETRADRAVRQGEVIGRTHLEQARGGAGEFERLRAFGAGEQPSGSAAAEATSFTRMS